MGPWGAAGPLGGASAMRPRSPVSLPAGPLAGGLVHDLSCVAAILLLELQESKVRGSVATAGSAGHTLGQGPPHLPWDELWAPAMLPGMPGNVSAPPRSVVPPPPPGLHLGSPETTSWSYELDLPRHLSRSRYSECSPGAPDPTFPHFPSCECNLQASSPRCPSSLSMPFSPGSGPWPGVWRQPRPPSRSYDLLVPSELPS